MQSRDYNALAMSVMGLYLFLSVLGCDAVSRL